jgi:outer membrane receptor for ferrienterochelin and colicins
MQLNHDLVNLFKRRHVITLGSEYISDEVQDEIASYRYKVDQHTKNLGSFVQSDWDISDKLNILSGVRMDKHNLIENLVFNPRLALLYKSNSSTQFRLSYGTGFRAPQAFDTDLHIAFAGGGVSRVRLDPNLKEERSQSISASVNYDKVWNKVISGFTLESFYTKLQNAFILENLGQDSFGELFEKRNGQSATVKGFTLELRANYNRKIQIETGATLQNSEFENPVEYIQGVEPRRLFLRTPNSYGFANISFTPDKIWSFNLNYVYTGSMEIAHFGGAINFTRDQMVETKSFSEFNCKVSYTLCLSKFKHDIELFAGMKNLLNDYQNDFDLGKNRDSNYIYGSSMPRSFFIGIKLRTD